MSTGQASVSVSRTGITGIMGPLLSLDLRCCGTRTIIEVSGELDMHTAHLLTELVEQTAQHRPTEVVLDMANVSFFCADGLRALLHARHTVATAGGQLLLRDPSPRTCRILTITRMVDLFPHETTTAPAAV